MRWRVALSLLLAAGLLYLFFRGVDWAAMGHALRSADPVYLAGVVLEHGRAADLVIAGQTDPDWDLSPLLDFPERLALEGVDVESLGRSQQMQVEIDQRDAARDPRVRPRR